MITFLILSAIIIIPAGVIWLNCFLYKKLPEGKFKQYFDDVVGTKEDIYHCYIFFLFFQLVLYVIFECLYIVMGAYILLFPLVIFAFYKIIKSSINLINK